MNEGTTMAAIILLPTIVPKTVLQIRLDSNSQNVHTIPDTVDLKLRLSSNFD